MEYPDPPLTNPTAGATPSEKLWSATLDAASEGMLVTDERAHIILVNRAYTKITGYRPEEVIGRNPRLLQSGRHDDKFYADMWQTLSEQGRWQGEVWNRRKNGECYPSWVSISAIRDEHGATTNYLGIFSDISVVKAAQKELTYLAHHDALTGLPNRLMLIERVEHALQLAKRTGSVFALLFIDLDKFKRINDTWGHEVGDHVLEEVARRISSVVRSADTVARLGGDEFVVLLENISQESDASRVTQQLLTRLREGPVVDEFELMVSASIGITIYPRDGDNTAALLRNADLAMFRAKEDGRGRAIAFRKAFATAAQQRTSIEQHLRSAIEERRINSVYQPTVELASGRTVGIEALPQLFHPMVGDMGPEQWMPSAEDSGDILRIGEWVLRQACSEAESLRRDVQFNGHLAVNVSIRQLECSNFVETVCRVLRDTGFPAQALVLEVAAGAMQAPSAFVVDTLSALHDMGVKLGIDDFGDSGASLAQLKRWPISVLKVDRSFVSNLAHSTDDAAIVRAVVGLGEHLDLSIIAKGVETPQQHDHLTGFGCCYGQGFHYHPPTQSTDLASLLSAGQQ